ncbi:MAG TPA: transcription termination/antitermination protein NusG [Alphaproteobacteria bacterium]|nr:transcription termination/antitermination protein NusG [Alphaproteobacteria bacterium]
MAFRWYVIQTQSNYEKKVQAAIKEQVIVNNLEDKVQEVLIPVEQVSQVKKGVTKTSEKKFYPGYILMYCDMTDEVWQIVNSISKASGFVGGGGGLNKRPLPISKKEAEFMLKQMEEGVESPTPILDVEVGDEVLVKEGPFASFQGIVEEVNPEEGKFKVSISIFGRPTSIELTSGQAEKV